MAGDKHVWWGTPLIRQVGIYEYGTSPFHLRVFKGAFTTGLYKVTKMIGRFGLMLGPPAAFFYSIAVWADGRFEYYHRKEWLLSPEGRASAEE